MSEPRNSPLRVGVVQMAPIFMDREATIAKIASRIGDASDAGCDLAAFGEALVPGYPVWLDRADGARFESQRQKELFARYAQQAAVVDEHLEPLQRVARERQIAVVLGVIERASDRGGHSLYCTRVFIDASGSVLSTHRKLMPTYEERLVWAHGDGAGLVTHPVGDFRVGSLLCWENWMPLARAALQADGENIHVALWPGGEHNTRPTTQFIARESRSFVLAASGLLRGSDVPSHVPHRDAFVNGEDELLLNGGSAIAGPDGAWISEPVVGREEILIADLDIARVYEERQNFDPAGHYARPDVLRMSVNRDRQRSMGEHRE